MTRAEYNLTRLRSLLQQAIASLPQPYRTIGELYLRDYCLSQIARAVGIPWETFYTRTWRMFLTRMRGVLCGGGLLRFARNDDTTASVIARRRRRRRRLESSFNGAKLRDISQIW